MKSELREKFALGRPMRVKLGWIRRHRIFTLDNTIVFATEAVSGPRAPSNSHHRRFYRNDRRSERRSVTRPHLDASRWSQTRRLYREQAFKILDPERTERSATVTVSRMSFEDVIRLNSRVTLQQLLQREDFKARIEEKHPIRAHEVNINHAGVDR